MALIGLLPCDDYNDHDVRAPEAVASAGYGSRGTSTTYCDRMCSNIRVVGKLFQDITQKFVIEFSRSTLESGTTSESACQWPGSSFACSSVVCAATTVDTGAVQETKFTPHWQPEAKCLPVMGALTACCHMNAVSADFVLKVLRGEVRTLSPVQFVPASEFTCDPKFVRSQGCSDSLGKVVRGKLAYLAKGDIICKSADAAMISYLKELCANDFYRHFGCHAQALSVCPDMYQILPGSSATCDAGECVHARTSHFVRDCTARVPGCSGAAPPKPGPHLISLWLDEFCTLNEVVIKQLCGVPAVVTKLTTTVQLNVNGTNIEYERPVIGLGRVLAVALFLNDIDCTGRKGANVGYTVVRDRDTGAPLYANAIKIDPGNAFADFDSESVGVEPPVAVDDVSALEIYLGGELKSTTFGMLPENVKLEMVEALADIVNCSAVELEFVFHRPGLAHVFGDSDKTSKYVDSLVRRQSWIRSVFGTMITAPSPVSFPQALMIKYSGCARIRDPVTLKDHPIDQSYINLSLLAENPDTKLSQDVAEALAASSPSKSGREMMMHSFEAIRATKASIELKDLMSRCLGSTRRVNVMGRAGVGKSTFCASIAKSWADGTLFQEFDVVLWIPLRNLTNESYPNGDSYSVVDVVIRECLGGQPSPILRGKVERTLATPSVLWILDGYDEIAGRVPAHLQPAYDSMMSSPNRILTGRPHVMSNIADANLRCDVEVEVAGFTNTNIRLFVRRFIASIRVEVTEQQLYSLLRENTVAWELSHIPVNLVLMCHVLCDSIVNCQTAVISQLTLLQLYQQVEQLLWKRYCGRLKDVDVTKMAKSEIAGIWSPLSKILVEIAFAGMRHGTATIPGETVLSILADCGHGIATLQSLLLTGFIVQASAAGIEADYSKSQFQFLHLTLQEYFAAKYVFGAMPALHHSRHEGSGLEWLRKHSQDLHLEIMWRFMSDHDPPKFGSTSTEPPAVAVLSLSLLEQLSTSTGVGHQEHYITQFVLKIVEENKLVWHYDWALCFAIRVGNTSLQHTVSRVFASFPHKVLQGDVYAALQSCMVTSLLLHRELLKYPDSFPWLRPEFIPAAATSVEGLHMASLDVRQSQTEFRTYGLAVNDGATLMAVSNWMNSHITVFSLPTCEELVSFGGEGSGEGQFHKPWGLCFTVDGTLLVADSGNQSITDMKITGEYKRRIGRGMAPLTAVAANADIVVGSRWQEYYIAIFDYSSGNFVRGFCERGYAPGQLSSLDCVCIAPDGRHIIVSDNTYRLSVFTTTGHFVRDFGQIADADGTRPFLSLRVACQASNGDIVAASMSSNTVVVLSPDGSRVLRRFGSYGTAAGQFEHPGAIAFAQGRLYVADNNDGRVQVFK